MIIVDQEGVVHSGTGSQWTAHKVWLLQSSAGNKRSGEIHHQRETYEINSKKK